MDEAFVTGEEVRITLRAGKGSIVAVFPAHGDPEFERAKKELLDSRFVTGRHGKTKNVASEARVRFFDSQCQRVENWQHKLPDGTVVDAMGLPNWRALFPANLKVSIVGPNFEEQETLDEEDRERLPTTSDGD